MEGKNPEKQQPVTTANIDYFLKEGFVVGLASCLNCSFKWITILPPEARKACRNIECPECGNKNNNFRHITLKNKSRVLKNFNV